MIIRTHRELRDLTVIAPSWKRQGIFQVGCVFSCALGTAVSFQKREGETTNENKTNSARKMNIISDILETWMVHMVRDMR